jgi:hypothetical protein
MEAKYLVTALFQGVHWAIFGARKDLIGLKSNFVVISLHPQQVIDINQGLTAYLKSIDSY